MTTLLNKTIRLFLDSIGRREEYEFYLKKFQTDEHPCFAVLCPDRVGFEDVSSFFSFDIQFMLQLELAPMILLCGEDVQELMQLLMTEDHPYLEHAYSGLEQLIPFLEECRTQGKAGLVLAPDQTQSQVLPEIIPDVARRVHFIRTRGPLRAANEERIFCYYTARPNPVDVGETDEPLLDRAAALLDQRPGTHISIASPWNLLKELFTVKGAGCMVRRGSIIQRHVNGDGIDEDRLAALLEDSFGKPLRDRDVIRQAGEIYLEESYRGAVMLELIEQGTYLSKFAVGTEARGEGLAYELWQDFTRDHPRLFWRAGPGNPIYQWYEKQADGYHREGRWIIFWRGIDSAHLSQIIEFGLNRPDDFKPIRS